MSTEEPDVRGSTPVTSNQHHLHRNLAKTVLRHLAAEHHAIVAGHNLRAYERLRASLDADGRPLILDSFCGTGQSTRQLAQTYPDHLVVGIDKSAYRLAKHVPARDKDYLLLRAECEPLWQLLAQDGTTVSRHYLLYPNPWPKSKHLQRRIHGHANFPHLIALGGRLELRSNWKIYVEEFGTAMHIAGQAGTVSSLTPDTEPLTLFEKKYFESGHTLWRYSVNLVP